MDDLNFSLNTQSSEQRSAYRAMVRGIQMRIKATNALYEIHDISAHGCSIAAPLHEFALKETVTIDLEIKGQAILRGLDALVARHVPNGLVGFSFDTPTAQQELVLDKIVLEIQKRQIARSKASFRQSSPQ